MTSHPTAQLGQSNMSSHPSIHYHQQAPVPIMQVQSAAIPAKRGPEDDVQFVSVQPVKKARGSRESPPAPAQIQQTPEQSNAPPQAQEQDSQAHGSQLSHPDAAATGPESESSSILNRGLSFPGLQNYTFPPPPDSKPCRTSRSSPILSPRQLPQNMLPNNSQASQDFRGFVQPPQFQVPWGMSSLYPQPAPMNSDMSLSQTTTIPMPSAQAHVSSISPAMDIDDQPLSMSIALRRPEPPRPSTPVSHPEVHSMKAEKSKVGSPTQQKEQANTAQAQSNQTNHERDHDQTNPLPYTSPRQEPRILARSPSHAQTRAPTPNATQPQSKLPVTVTTNNQSPPTGPDKPASQQTAPPKGSCVVCEQIRQQVLFNQVNGLPISHLPPMSHGWHGQAPITQVPMGHPNAAAAFGVMSNMLPNLQQRFQPLSLGHLPMGYGMQHIPVQVQMQSQRQTQAQNMTGHESSQNSPSQNQQGQQMQNQQTPGQVSQPATGQPAQYMHSPLQATLPQSVMIQRPIVMHQQTLATPSPPSPQATQTTSTPAPAPALPEPKKQHSPNLIVDIAETCEELFPWDEVAKRHGVTRVKVVDTFGAIIQLPLLRCTTDKKRHGKLATSRLREYTKAKKDTEANNAASASVSATRTTAPVSTPPPTSAAPLAQSQMSQLQASQLSANQAQNQLRQVQLMQAQAMQAQAMQAQAQANQMYANQSHINQNQHQSQPGQSHESQDRRGLPSAFEMPNTFSPLGLPSSLTHGLSGHWQQQQQQQQQHQPQ